MKKRTTIITLIIFSLAMTVMAQEKHGGDVIYTKPVKSVIFSHKTHVDDNGLSCDLCHTNNFTMQSLKAQENSDFTMKSLGEGKYCGACHNGTMAFASNTRCASCHIGVKGFVSKKR